MTEERHSKSWSLDSGHLLRSDGPLLVEGFEELSFTHHRAPNVVRQSIPF